MTQSKKGSTIKKFFLKLSAFIVVIFCIDFLGGLVLRKLYFKQTSGYDYLTTYALEQTNEKVLILGSSRAANIFNTSIVEKETGLNCYNAGRYGEPIFYHLAVLKGVLKRYKPEMILLSFDAGNFNINAEAYDRLSVLLPYYKSHAEIRAIVGLKGRYEHLKLLSGIYPFNSLLLPMITGNTEYSKKKYVNINGFIPIEKTFEGPLKTFDYTKDTVLDKLKVEAYKSFINDCKDARVPLFVICPPYMIHAMGTDPSITEGKAIAAEYHIPFIDFSRDTFYTSKPQLFADYRHLNADGVGYFTKAVLDTVSKYHTFK
jgi:hypothetical protein